MVRLRRRLVSVRGAVLLGVLHLWSASLFAHHRNKARCKCLPAFCANLCTVSSINPLKLSLEARAWSRFFRSDSLNRHCAAREDRIAKAALLSLVKNPECAGDGESLRVKGLLVVAQVIASAAPAP